MCILSFPERIQNIPLTDRLCQQRNGSGKLETVTFDPAIKYGAGRYRQEKNLLEECGKEISRFGKKAFIIAGNRAWNAVKERMIPGFEKAGLEYELHLYGGKCSYEAAREYAEKCKAENCNEVVGIGGGLVMDFAKAVGEYADTGVVNIPTSIATCAAFTTMSVMYTPEGAKKDCWRFEHEVDAVLVDLQVIAECPIRYAAAGILDAMAKKIEIQNGKPKMYLSENKIDLFSAYKMAEYTYEVTVCGLILQKKQSMRCMEKSWQWHCLLSFTTIN